VAALTRTSAVAEAEVALLIEDGWQKRGWANG
jgi:hypothetical protein